MNEMTKDEREEVTIQLDQDIEESLNITKRSLVGKVLAEKAFQNGAVKTILTEHGEIKRYDNLYLGTNQCLFTFTEDK
jgi:hypothetical protein